MDCLFCKIAAGEIPRQRFMRTAEVYAFADINPRRPSTAL